MKVNLTNCLLVLILIFPFVLLAQVKTVTTVPAAEMEVNGIIFSSRGGVKFPDGTIQTTAFVVDGTGMVNAGLSGLVMEFAATSLVEGPATGVGIVKGINISSFQEGVGVAVSLGSGGTGGTSTPSLSEVTISRPSDVNSTQIRKLLLSKAITPYIEVFFLKLVSSQYYAQHIIRYENCIITSLSTSSGGDEPFESVSFAFEKACYRSYQRDGSTNVVIRQLDTCYNVTTNVTNCTCGTF
jgi:type VI protein secretion system component Hcp